MKTFRIELEVQIGELEEIGLALRQEWISGERGERDYEMDSGTGLGSGRIDFRATEHVNGVAVNVYAKADGAQLAQAVWTELDKELDAKKEAVAGT
jgi:hypothetical protein